MDMIFRGDVPTDVLIKAIQKRFYEVIKSKKNCQAENYEEASFNRILSSFNNSVQIDYLFVMD